jgi:trk system potassium uptake protein TrkA
VSIIERDPRVATEIQARIDVPVVVGDGSMAQVLDEAGATRCKVFAAVTGRDEDNLVACQTVRTLFQGKAESPPKTIARISDPNNENLYRALGVDATVSATSIIQAVIERELPTLHIKTLLQLSAGGASILEVTLGADAPVIDHPLRDVVLPKESNVVAVLRGARTVVPRGDTVFKAGDVVITLVAKESEEELKRLLIGEPPPADAHDMNEPHGAGQPSPKSSKDGAKHDQKH